MRAASKHCYRCQGHVYAVLDGPNHLLHLLASAFLLGLWLVPWAIVASQPQPWRCTRCGAEVGRHQPKVGSIIGATALAVVGVVAVVAACVHRWG